MQVQNLQLDGFLLSKIVVIFITTKAPEPDFMITHISFNHSTKPIVVSIASLSTLNTLFCTLTLLHEKHMIMQL